MFYLTNKTRLISDLHHNFRDELDSTEMSERSLRDVVVAYGAASRSSHVENTS